MENKKTFGHLAALLTIVIWGTTYISTKILLVDFKPVEILFFRFVMGFVILIAISPKQLKTKSRKEELTFILAGLCGICLYYLLENIALTYTLASKCWSDYIGCPILYSNSSAPVYEIRGKTAYTVFCRIYGCNDRNCPNQL